MDRVLFPTLLLSGASTAAVTTASADPTLAVIGCACFTAFLVRAAGHAKSSKKKKEWAFEIIVSILTVFLAGVAAVEYKFSIGSGAVVGFVLGSLGASIITIGRSFGLTFIQTWLGNVIKNPPKE